VSTPMSLCASWTSIVILMIVMMLGTGIIVSLDSLIMLYVILINCQTGLVGKNQIILDFLFMCGCEFWSLADRVIEEFCAAWRKSLRRVLILAFMIVIVMLLTFIAVWYDASFY
jgi:hypothetical protein